MGSRLKNALLAAAALPFVAGPVCACPQEAKKPPEKWQIDGITTALKDPVPEVRAEVFDVSGPAAQIEWGRTLEPALISLLTDPDQRVRRAALSALGTMQATDQEPALVSILKDKNEDPGTRSYAALALGTMQARDQEPALVSILKDKNENAGLRHDVAFALGNMQAKDRATDLFALATDKREDRSVRDGALSALGTMQATDQAQGLGALLRDKTDTAGLRAEAADALGQMKARDHAAELVSILMDRKEDYILRGSAADALGEMQAKEQETELVLLLKDRNEDSNLRGDAVRALREMQANDQKAALVSLLKDPTEDSSVQSEAVLALRGMEAKEQGPALVALLKDKQTSQTVRRDAVLALGSMQAREQEAVLVSFVKDKSQDASVRAPAIEALGTMQARGQEPLFVSVLKDKNEYSVVRTAAVAALGNIRAKDQEPELASILKDRKEDLGLRVATLYALAAMQAKNLEPEMIALLKDPAFRQYAAPALVSFAPLEPSTLPLLSDTYYFNHADQAKTRFRCHYLLGGAPASELVLKHVMFETGEGNPRPVPIGSIEEARETLRAFHEILPSKPEDTGFAADAERQILQIAREWKNTWSSADRELLSSLSHQMSDNNAATLRGLLETPVWVTVLEKLWKVIAVQLLLWIALLLFYPTSPQVQAFFFWNRWARKFVGLGYVDFCLTWIPFLRNRLLAPFREDLIADARISDENLKDYFPDIQVKHGELVSPISQAIPDVAGQIVLEGESGLGKSIFLRRLASNSTQPAAYLPAENCDHGVFELIQRKLKGKGGDETFLRSIIWSGGLRIVIDGLNEVSVETREKIRRFVDDFPKANVLLATQPMLWKRPPKAKVFRILPLTDDRIQAFLESRYTTFTQPVALTGAAYDERCREYLSRVLASTQSEEDRSAARLVLSNPMDLTTAAQILVGGETPTLKNLQQQQFSAVDHDFRDTHAGQPFPLTQFSDGVYERLLQNEITLDREAFFEPIQALAAHKMVLTQNGIDAEGKPIRRWVFRHDRIRDFFLMQAFTSRQDERILKHMDDPRFRGVYLMLASQLPLGQASELKEALVDRAAETKDHHLSDAVVEVLKNRRATSKPASHEISTA